MTDICKVCCWRKRSLSPSFVFTDFLHLINLNPMSVLILLARENSHLSYFVLHYIFSSTFYISIDYSYKMTAKSYLWVSYYTYSKSVCTTWPVCISSSTSISGHWWMTKVMKLTQRRKREPSSIKVENIIACRFRPWVVLKKRLDQCVNLHLNRQWLTKFWPIAVGFS